MTTFAEVLAAHSMRTDFNHPGYNKCRCGFDPWGWTEDGTDEGVDNPSWAEHVAEAVAAAGLEVVDRETLRLALFSETFGVDNRQKLRWQLVHGNRKPVS